MRRRRFIDYMARRDGRNPYGSRGGYVVSSRRDRARGMDYAYDRGDYRGGNYEYGSRRGDMAYSQQDMERGRRDYEYTGQPRMDYEYDMRGNYDMARGGRDMHYGRGQGNFQPVEAMGYFTGYYGGGQDMARRDYGYNYDMRGRDYGYDYAGDYGESLSKEELEDWCKKMMSKLDERQKQMLSKDMILQRAKSMGVQFDKFNEMEYYVNVVRNFTDHKQSVGDNIDMIMKLAKDDFHDEDGEYKGSEWLAVYYDTFVEAED
jgi:hypothetical protein